LGSFHSEMEPGPAVVFATAFSRTFAEAMAESYRFEVGRAL
jgi:hypothetical protein